MNSYKVRYSGEATVYADNEDEAWRVALMEIPVYHRIAFEDIELVEVRI